MPFVKYVDKNFAAATLITIEHANAIISDYSAQGFTLTLRQLFYQYVSRGLLANNQREYDRLGSITNDARLAGMIDWHAIEDRTRWLRRNDVDSSTPEQYLLSAVEGYSKSRWVDQRYAPEVWIEKDALVGVVESACDPLFVPYFACRGYVSQSEVWIAAQRMIDHRRDGREPIIFHLGDHDPSGIDMTRDLGDRLALFCKTMGYEPPEIIRLALNMEQVEEMQPPPNPAKLSDSRAEGYIAKYGDESWELDAIDPTTLAQLITDNLEPLIERDKWELAEEAEENGRVQLRRVAESWKYVNDMLRKPHAQRDIDGNYS